MKRALIFIIVCLLSAPAVSGHAFNHGTRHEDCDIYDDPHGHAVDDGHIHWHHNAAVGAHEHDGIVFPADHTHPNVAHDPCNQIGMQRPAWDDAAPLAEVSIADAGIGNVAGVPVIIGDEAYDVDADALIEQKRLVVTSDNVLDAMGFPGSGTHSDPYIIEGYLIRDVLLVKDTSKCIVLRNNVVHSDAIEGGFIDVEKLVDREALLATLEAAIAVLEDLIEDQGAEIFEARAILNSAQATLEQAAADYEEASGAKKTWDAEMAELIGQKAAKADALAGTETASTLANAAIPIAKDAVAAQRDVLTSANENLVSAKGALNDAIDAHEAAQSAFETFVEEFGEPEPPAREYRDDTGGITFDAVDTFLEAYDDFVADNTPADETLQETYNEHEMKIADAGRSVELARAELTLAGFQVVAAEDKLAADIESVNAAQKAAEAAEEAVDDAAADLATVQRSIDALAREYEPLADAEEDAREALDVAQAAYDEARRQLAAYERNLAKSEAKLAESAAAAEGLRAAIANGAIEYLGEEFESLSALVESVLAELETLLDPKMHGLFILDWNGPCIHAYNNVIEDLRVNRNNGRTGFATGGLMEDNRIGTIGQIRHYDGEFRENEVGNRDHADYLLDNTIPLTPTRSVNADGYNEAWFHHNTFYGSIDLDLHGHHHGAGFFAPESHYHGSTYKVGYMVNAQGQCSYAGQPYGQRSLGQDLGLVETNDNCLPHHDHRKRWTSVSFEDNVVIDPLGRGIRYEDRNHEGDDREANSEDMIELNSPHFHRTHLQIQDNAVVGQVFLDIVNADGIEVWSDDHSEVEKDPVTGEVIDAAIHLGATRINSHAGRNDAWVDVTGNALYPMARQQAILVRDAKEMEQLAIENNNAFAVAQGSSLGAADRGELLEIVAAGRDADADTHAAAIAPDGLGRSGMQTAIFFIDIADSNIKICGNSLLGFDRGLMARDRIYNDVSLKTCSQNDWGNADPRITVAFTPVPTAAPRTTDPIRGLSDGTLAGSVADPVYDEVDVIGKRVGL